MNYKGKINIKAPKGFTISELVVVFAIVFIVALLMFPIIKYNQTKLNKTICANNLRQLGLAMYIYAKEHEGVFPPALDTLYAEEYLGDEKVMDCPASKDVGTLKDPDYIYTGGLSVKDDFMSVLIKDRSRNHAAGGKNVLRVNGSVEWEK